LKNLNKPNLDRLRKKRARGKKKKKKRKNEEKENKISPLLKTMWFRQKLEHKKRMKIRVILLNQKVGNGCLGKK
jgi:DNA repair protein RadC